MNAKENRTLRDVRTSRRLLGVPRAAHATFSEIKAILFALRWTWAWPFLGVLIPTAIGIGSWLVSEQIYQIGRVLILMALALLLLKTFHQSLSARIAARQRISISLASITALALLIYSSLGVINRIEWKHEVVINLPFKTSPLLTEARKHRIIWNLNSYYRYLSNIGFDFPVDIPPVQISPPNSVNGGGGSPGASYFSTLTISEDNIDNPAVIRAVYSSYIFNRAIYWPAVLKQGTPQSQIDADEAAAWMMGCYFASSFGNRIVCGTDAAPGRWLDALWDARRQYKHESVDKLMYYTFATWNSFPVKYPESFDKSFRYHLIAGGIAQGIPNLDPILKRHGIDTGPF